MKLTLWTYEGPTHVGAMRVATAMRDLHYVLHAPQGDTYADLLFTMIERNDTRPPVTYTTFQARDLGGDTATLFQDACRAAYERFKPSAMLVGASCTAELIQDDPGGLAAGMKLPVPTIPLELPSYRQLHASSARKTGRLPKRSTTWCAALRARVRYRLARNDRRAPRANARRAICWAQRRSVSGTATMFASSPRSCGGWAST